MVLLPKDQFAPIAIPPVAFPALIIALALIAGLALSHLQKEDRRLGIEVNVFSVALALARNHKYEPTLEV